MADTPTPDQIEAFIRAIPTHPDANRARRSAAHVPAAGVTVIERDALPTPHDYEQFVLAEDRFEDHPDPVHGEDEFGAADDDLPTDEDRVEFDRNEELADREDSDFADRRAQEDAAFAERRAMADSDFDERAEAWAAAGRDGDPVIAQDDQRETTRTPAPGPALDDLAARLDSVGAQAVERTPERVMTPADEVLRRFKTLLGMNTDGTQIEGPPPEDASRAESKQSQPATQDSRPAPSVLNDLASRLQTLGQPQIARRQEAPEASRASTPSVAPSAAPSAPSERPQPQVPRPNIPSYSSPAAFDAKIDAAVRARSTADIQAAADRHRQNPTAGKETSKKSTDEDRRSLAGMGRLELADTIAARGMALKASRREGLPDEIRATRQQGFERAVGESMARDRQQADVGKMWMRAATQAHMSGDKPNILPDRQADSAALAKMTDKDLAREVGLRARAADVANATNSPDRDEANAAFKVAADQVIGRAEAKVKELRAERAAGREAIADRTPDGARAATASASPAQESAGSPFSDMIDEAGRRDTAASAQHDARANAPEPELSQK
jgi:hypothetical protein